MPFFPLIPLQEMILAFSLGLGLFILLYVAWNSYPRRLGAGSPEEDPTLQTPDPRDVHEAANNPIPPFLIFVYVGVAVWMVAYLIFIGLRIEAIG
jgi:hypothetical protein